MNSTKLAYVAETSKSKNAFLLVTFHHTYETWSCSYCFTSCFALLGFVCFFFSLGYSLFSVLQRNTYSIQACFLVAFVCLIYSCLRREKKKKDLEVFSLWFFSPYPCTSGSKFLFLPFFFFFSQESSKDKNIPASRTTQEPTLTSLFSTSQVFVSQTAIQETLLSQISVQLG